MAKEERIKCTVSPVPQTLNEAADFLRQIGEKQQAIRVIESTLDAEVKRLQAQATTEVGPHQERIDELFAGLFAFAQSNRDKLTKDGKRKTIPVATGKFGWRMTPLSVSIDNPDEVVAELKRRNLKDLIRVVEEPDKGKIREAPNRVKNVPGIIFSQREMFSATPARLQVKVESDVEELKKAVA